MTYERNVQVTITRKIYVAKCQCGETDIRDANPPRERRCQCGEWVPYKEESYTGPELGR